MEIEIATKKVLCSKRTIKTWDFNFHNIVISKLVNTKTSSKYLIGYLDKTIRPLILIMPKMSGFIKKVKVKEGDKDKNNKLMSFRIDGEELFGLRLKI